MPEGAAARPSGCARRGAALLLGADERRTHEQHEHDEGRGQPRQRGEDAVDPRQHDYQGDGSPLFEMNHQALVSHTPTSSVNSAPPASGSAIPGSECERTTTTFAANAP